MIVLFVAILGLFIGSFLNVCIHRIPSGESIVWPGSKCPKCDNPIKPWDNIPVLSYLILRGRCRNCSAPISVRYPLVELLSSLIAVALLFRFGPGVRFVIYYFWACALLVITFIDLDLLIIPDRLSIGGAAVGILLIPWLMVGWKDALIGLTLGAGMLAAVIYGYFLLTGKQGMGGGDVKLLGMIGVFTGWQGVLFTVFMGSLMGTVVGIPWAYFHKNRETTTLKAAIPFGPFLSLGALLYVLWGDAVINWYFSFMP